MWIVKIFIPEIDNYISIGKETLEKYKWGFLLILILAILLLWIMYKKFKMKIVKSLILVGICFLIFEVGLGYKAITEINDRIKSNNPIEQSNGWD